MKSIRKHLILTLVLCLSVLFAGASLVLYLHARNALQSQFDEALTTKIMSFVEMAEAERKIDVVVVELEFVEFPLPEFLPSPDAEYYQVWNSDGTVLARSQSLEERDLPQIPAGPGVPNLEDIELPDGRRGRAVAAWFEPPGEPASGSSIAEVQSAESPLFMMLARSRESLDFALTALVAGFGGMWGLLVIGLIVTVGWSVKRGLSPLVRIARDADSIGSANLSHRFPIEPLPHELVPIGRRLNELLGRIEAAFLRERRFSADVAHELRTPLAELHTLAEVALRMEPDPSNIGTYCEYLGDVLDIAKQMESMVTVLLSLVRCDADRGKIKPEAVDLPDLVRKAVGPFQGEARDRELSLELNLPAAAVATSDRSLLSSILTNLFANAVSHTPRGGNIRCDIAVREDRFLLSLVNTDDQLEPADLEHLFEPFWQKDSSRSTIARNGLGLSLVAAYAELLGLNLSCSLPKKGFFMVSLTLPAHSK